MVIPSAWYTVNASLRIMIAKQLVNAGPTMATIPVLFAPMRATAAVVKNVGITVQKIAITSIQKRPSALTSGALILRVRA